MDEDRPQLGSRSPLVSVLLTAGSVLAAVVPAGLLVAYTDWPREAVLMAGFFVLAALLWTTEALPLFAASLKRLEITKLPGGGYPIPTAINICV